jgi:kexin
MYPLKLYSFKVHKLTLSRGESGIGTWSIIVKDTVVNEFSGTFTDWHLKLWGECIDPKLAHLLPMPTDEDDDDHDKTITTTTLAATPTAVVVEPVETAVPANPTDHPDRPVNAKPTGVDNLDEVVKPTSTATGELSTSDGNWLPSFFPTFGVSSKTLIWIYGALALILTFMIGLGIYFLLARRRRLRNNPRDDYEFELLNEEEAQGLTAGGEARGGKGKRRAGELYDAFAAGSEEDLSGDDEAYRDKGEREQHVIGDDDDDEEEGEGSEEAFDEKAAEKARLKD